LQLISTSYVFVADIDMIFNNQFIDKLTNLCKPNQSVYFKVGFLDKKITNFSKSFDSIPISSLSKDGAQGLSLFFMIQKY
jgi:hypothetical protein